ncbi:MAG TPA: hypothetical protein VFL04_07530, partial [Rectinemataceae bacterium]|nr:hypothetical protein [Rectinemataceae bacterium]
DLIPKRGLSTRTIVAIAVAGLAVLGLVLGLSLGGRRDGTVESAGAHRAPVEYRLDKSPFEKRLYLGDSLLVNSGTDTYKLLISNIGDAVTIDTPAGPTRLMLGEEGTIDLDKNNQPELKVLVTDLSKKDSSKGALLHFEFSSAEAALKASSEAPTPDSPATAPAAASAPAAAPAATAPAPAAPSPVSVPAGSKSVVLFESGKSPYPFVVSVTFRGSCMFRYEVDRKDRDERYYRKGETISVSANNSVKLWASNGQSAKLSVQASGGKNADIDLGGPGEVSVKRIAWSQTDSGGWTLSALDVD